MGGASAECQAFTLDITPSHLAVLKYQDMAARPFQCSLQCLKLFKVFEAVTNNQIPYHPGYATSLKHQERITKCHGN